jgi:hypothetical protein
VETATQFTLTLAQRFLEWLRMEWDINIIKKVRLGKRKINNG